MVLEDYLIVKTLTEVKGFQKQCVTTFEMPPYLQVECTFISCLVTSGLALP